VLAGAPRESVYRFKGDEFGRLDLPQGVGPLAVGTRVVLIPSHCDPTVNLHGVYHLLREGSSAGTWPAEGRGYGGSA